MGRPTKQEAELLIQLCKDEIVKSNIRIGVSMGITCMFAVSTGIASAAADSKNVLILGIASTMLMCNTHIKVMKDGERKKRVSKYLMENAHRDFDEVSQEIIKIETGR